MFEVLVYVYENYWRGDACPDLPALERRLNAAGFPATEIEQALAWLDGLDAVARHLQPAQDMPLPASALTLAPDPLSMRVYSVGEQDHLGAEALSFLYFLESAGVLPPALREIVLDRAMAAPGEPVTLGDLKLIVLMVYWRFGEEPDALVLDELTEDTRARVAH